MVNPILQMLNQQSRQLNPANNIISMIKNSQNPQALISNMMAQNPQVANIINAYGGDPKAAFYGLAQQKGVNPDDILNMLRK